jgi:hypothetical protein
MGIVSSIAAVSDSSKILREQADTALERGRSQRQRVETRSLPTLTRSYPCRFTFYVADPISSIQLMHRSLLRRMHDWLRRAKSSL